MQIGTRNDSGLESTLTVNDASCGESKRCRLLRISPRGHDDVGQSDSSSSSYDPDSELDRYSSPNPNPNPSINLTSDAISPSNPSPTPLACLYTSPALSWALFSATVISLSSHFLSLSFVNVFRASICLILCSCFLTDIEVISLLW